MERTERSVSIQFRLSPEEKDELQKRAEASHLSVSSYIRLKVLSDENKSK